MPPAPDSRAPWWPASGPGIPVRTDRWLQSALYDPAHGYYRARRRRPGGAGDFITPVTLGKGALGGVLARWARAAGLPAVVEIGGGGGRLARSFLQELQVPYRVVDWGDEGDGDYERREPESPGPPSPGALLLGVEVLDALPVRRFRLGAAGWEEEWWAADEEGAWYAEWVPAQGECPAAGLPEEERGPGVVELSPGLKAAVAEWGALAPGGRALFVDYGKEEPTGDSLRGFLRHRLLEPLGSPGEADWTATVRWPLARRAFAEAGFTEVLTQPLGLFLAGLGEEAVFGGGDTPGERLAVKELLSPVGMGEGFQALTATAPQPASARSARP